MLASALTLLELRRLLAGALGGDMVPKRNLSDSLSTCVSHRSDSVTLAAFDAIV